MSRTRLAVNTQTVRCRMFYEETLHYVNWNSPTALVPRSCELAILQVHVFFLSPSPPRHSYVINSFYRCCVICLVSLLHFLYSAYTILILLLLLFYNTSSWVLNYTRFHLYNVIKNKKKIVCIERFIEQKFAEETKVFAFVRKSKESLSLFVHSVQLIDSN